MTETLTTTTSDQAAAIGPGRLVLVVGPSGAGKDTLLGLVRAACADDGNVVFPRRVITREASASEENEEVSIGTFQEALTRGEYAMHWEAHGHCYALSRTIDDEIRAGRTIVANVSRTVIGAMRCAYANVVVVSITAPPNVLAERIAMRAKQRRRDRKAPASRRGGRLRHAGHYHRQHQQRRIPCPSTRPRHQGREMGRLRGAGYDCRLDY
jgi:ribose 1,5-bisphosphokinase